MSLFIAAQTAFVEFADKRVKIIKDSTIVRAGHEILNGNEHLFKRLHVHYDCERPKAPVTPPKAPPAKTVQAKPAAATAVAPETAEEE